jgi:hypothetical protein
MAIRDDDRRMRGDYMRAPQASNGSKWTAAVIGLAVLVAIVFAIAMMSGPDTGNSPPQTTNAPSTSTTPSTPPGNQQK